MQKRGVNSECKYGVRTDDAEDEREDGEEGQRVEDGHQAPDERRDDFARAFGPPCAKRLTN